jgi:hypothetical protein
MRSKRNRQEIEEDNRRQGGTYNGKKPVVRDTISQFSARNIDKKFTLLKQKYSHIAMGAAWLDWGAAWLDCGCSVARLCGVVRFGCGVARFGCGVARFGCCVARLPGAAWLDCWVRRG